MTDINSVNIIGRVTADAVLKYTTAGKAVTTISIAVNRAIKRNGIWEDKASFFDVVIWGKTAENLAQYLVKGKQIAVSGILDQQTWQGNDGQRHSKVVILAEHVVLASGGNAQKQGFQNGKAANNQYQQQYNNAYRQNPPAGNNQQQTPAMYSTPEPDYSDFPEEIPF